MKKALLALAVLSTFASCAQAQTNVTIGGVLAVNVKSYSVGNSTRPTARETRVDDDFNSRFWLTGTEDLGGGNSAIFFVDNRINMDVNNVQGTGNGLANGDSWVGLRGSWGQVTAGKHSWISVQGLTAEVMNGAGGPGLAGFYAIPSSMSGTYSVLNQYNGTYLDITRRANSIQYVSPNMSGFVVKGGFAASGSNGNEGNLACTGIGVSAIVSGTGITGAAGTAATVSSTASPTCGQLTTPAGGATNAAYADGRELFLQGSYANGPVNVALGYRNNNAEGRVGTDDRQIRFTGTYTLPIGLKVGLQLDRATRTPIATGTSVSRTAWEIPVSYVIGKSAILANYTRAGDAGGVANTGAKMYVVGWDYAMSRRTNVGVYYSKLSNDSAGTYQPFLAGTSFNGSSLAAGESASTLALGVKHVF